MAAVHVLDGLWEASCIRCGPPFHPELVHSIGKSRAFVDDDRPAPRQRTVALSNYEIVKKAGATGHTFEPPIGGPSQ